MADQPTSAIAPLKVLLVCTGNICRSPLAEQLLRAEASKLGVSDLFVFESAGVAAEVGQDVHSQTKASMTRFGHSIEPHVARQLDREILESADLVLTSTAEHRSAVAHLNVRANRYTFTCKEFIRIAKFLASDLSHLEDSDQQAIASISSPAEFVTTASKFRGYAPRPDTNEDIIDPWGLSPATYDVVTAEIELFVKDAMASLGAK